MSVLLGLLFFLGLPLMVWYVVIRATYRIETAGQADSDDSGTAPHGVPATREFTIFLWSIVVTLISAGVCLTWSPTTTPTWPPPTNTAPYQIVAVMVLMVGSASALSCLTPRIYTGAYTAAAGIYAGVAIPFIYLAYQDPTGQSGIGVVILDIFGNIGLVIALSIVGAIRVWWLRRKDRRQTRRTTK